jgi:hypothetical protein
MVIPTKVLRTPYESGTATLYVLTMIRRGEPKKKKKKKKFVNGRLIRLGILLQECERVNTPCSFSLYLWGLTGLFGQPNNVYLLCLRSTNK